MDNKDWQVNKQLEEKYKASLATIAKLIFRNVQKFDNVDDVTRFLQGLPNYKSFQDLANNMASRFVTMADEIEKRTWREAAKEVSRSRELYEGLKETINGTLVGAVIRNKVIENATLIKTLPLHVAQDVTKLVATETWKGARSSEAAKLLHDKIKDYTRARANLIARTESSKAMTALTQARSQDIGADWYIWRTANDGLRVREAHRHMKDVLVNFNNPPAPEELIGDKTAGHYNAGNIYNCRCFPRPILSLDTVSWPSKVYYNGQIVSMNRNEFERISGIHKNAVYTKMPIPKQQVPVPEEQKLPQFRYEDYVIVERDDLEEYTNKFWRTLSSDEMEATRKYIATGNSFSLNRFLYTGGYEKAKKVQGETKLHQLKNKLKDLELEHDRLWEEGALREARRPIQEQIRQLKHEIEDLENNGSSRSSDMRYIEEIDKFSAIVKKAKIPKSMKVVRNVDNDFVQYLLNKIGINDKINITQNNYEEVVNLLNKKARGASYTNESFTSTSFNAGANVFTGRPVQLEFYVEEGTTGLVTINWYESEIVFDIYSKIQLMDFEVRETKDRWGDTNKNLILKARILK